MWYKGMPVVAIPGLSPPLYNKPQLLEPQLIFTKLELCISWFIFEVTSLYSTLDWLFKPRMVGKAINYTQWI